MPPLLLPQRQLSLVPPGTEIERVDNDSPLLKRNPLVIEARTSSDTVEILQKINDYREWFSLVEGLGHRSQSFGQFADAVNPIQAVAQELYSENEDSDPEYASGVDSIILIYPNGLQASIDSLVSNCPPHLLVYSKGGLSGGGRAVHVSGRDGTKSLGIVPHPLDIVVDDGGWFMSLNNPSKAGFGIFIPKDEPPIYFGNPIAASRMKEECERDAWEAVEWFLQSTGLKVEATPYPNGPNNFPDYGANIEGVDVDVEITSVPDLKPWTIKSHYRDLEKMCREIAQNLGETEKSVFAEVRRVIANKKAILANQVPGECAKKCLLVVSNRSAVELEGQHDWAYEDLSEFVLVVVIERDRPYVVHGDPQDFL